MVQRGANRYVDKWSLRIETVDKIHYELPQEHAVCRVSTGTSVANP
jgi:hypothetical protein